MESPGALKVAIDHLAESVANATEELKGVRGEMQQMAVNQAVTHERIEQLASRVERLEKGIAAQFEIVSERIECNAREINTHKLNWAKVMAVAGAAAALGSFGPSVFEAISSALGG